FSSRRRHTRLQGDWSSDVCSSDLTASTVTGRPPASEDPATHSSPSDPSADATAHVSPLPQATAEYTTAPELAVRLVANVHQFPRSEERRVGKECRSR